MAQTPLPPIEEFLLFFFIADLASDSVSHDQDVEIF